MSARELVLEGAHFAVAGCAIAQNYSDVSDLFSHCQGVTLKPEPIIFDVGANIGIYSLSYAVLFFDAQVYSVEPHPGTYELLMQSLALNKGLESRIHPFNVGFSDAERTLELSIPTAVQHPRYDPKKNQINCGLYSVHGQGMEGVRARFLTLDDFCLRQGVRRVDFIKIDVEGHEYEVLQGGVRTIGEQRPVVYMEYNDLTRALSRYDGRAFTEFFARFGYVIYGMEQSDVRARRYLSDLSIVSEVTDILCLPPSHAMSDAALRVRDRGTQGSIR